eukprot:7177394-Karenia_brevis.AAC.1
MVVMMMMMMMMMMMRMMIGTHEASRPFATIPDPLALAPCSPLGSDTLPTGCGGGGSGTAL